MAESRDYDELYWAWDAWRDEVGAPAREDYKRYVELKNIAANANGKLSYPFLLDNHYENTLKTNTVICNDIKGNNVIGSIVFVSNYSSK